MTVEAKTNMKFKPWQSPNFVALALEHQQDSKEVAASIPVTELSAEALAALAQNWLDDLYTKANQPSPFQRMPL